MASIHKEKDCRNWIASFYGPDGRRCRKSTGTPDRSKALSIALTYEAASKDGREKRLTEARVRAVIADLFKRANREVMPSDTVANFLESWQRRKSLEVADSSMATYAQVCRELADSLGAKASGPVDAVALKDATRFRDGLAKRVSATTTNKLLKIARVIWNDAMRDSLTTENPFAKVKRLKADSTPRRAFTEEEVQRLLAVADRDWRGMILCGIYLGQRLGDLATLTWNNIDLAKGEVFLVTRKTGKPMRRGIHEALHRHLMAMPTPDDPDAPLFPTLHGLKTETLSGQFNRIAAAAGLARTDPLHKKARKGRDARRESRGMSFHCLRHTTTSMLKNAGVSDAIAREIVGHDSEAISRQYTHIETGTMRAAINKLPDVTKNQEATR